MIMLQQRDIFTSTTSHHTQLVRQSHQEVRDVVKSDMVHWQKRHLYLFFHQKKNSHMQSVLYPRHLNQMVLHQWLQLVRHACHLWQLVFLLREWLLVFHADLLQVIQMMIISFLQIFRDLKISLVIWTLR